MARSLKIKEKMSQIKDRIDEMEEREHDAKLALKEAETKEEQFEKEADAIRRRTRLLNQELVHTTSRLEEATAKLNRIEAKHETTEESRRELEQSEIGIDERLRQMEERLKEAQDKEEESSAMLVDAERRYKVLERDFEREESKAESFLARIDILEETIERATRKMQKLEENDDEAAGREELSGEKLLFLDGQLKETIVRLEDAERRCGQLDRYSESIITEIDSWAKKKKEVLDDMDDLEGIADD